MQAHLHQLLTKVVGIVFQLRDLALACQAKKKQYQKLHIGANKFKQNTN
jgi:hypothetical protein